VERRGELSAHLRGSEITVLGDEPGAVVVSLESAEGLIERSDSLEGAKPQELIFEGAYKALRDAVALRLRDE